MRRPTALAGAAEAGAGDTAQINRYLLKKVDELELSVRGANCLKNDNIIYIGDLVQKTEAEMLRTPNFGRKTLNEIKEVLSSMVLRLGVEIPGWPPENIEEMAKKLERRSWANPQDRCEIQEGRPERGGPFVLGQARVVAEALVPTRFIWFDLGSNRMQPHEIGRLIRNRHGACRLALAIGWRRSLARCDRRRRQPHQGGRGTLC